jgi:NADPH:quinone reductase-like Zn-dependent oxidoreductase
MKAAQISQYGDPSVVKINEADQPTPGAGQVVVEVHASSLNPFDTSVRAGYMKDMIPLKFPATLGGDIAGVVQAVGEGVTGFKVGDHVYGQANIVAGNSGAWAEFAATAAGQVALAPKNLNFAEAASLALVGVSALQALVHHLGLKSGQKLFVHGGSGGIGTVAIQLAKHLGAHVATTATGDGLALTRQLGADEIIDYKTQDFTAAVQHYDAAFNNVAADATKTLDTVKRGGTVVSMTGQFDDARAKELGVTAIAQHTQVTTAALDELRGLIESGAITPHIDQTFPLDRIVEALQARESNPVKGKIAITIKPN